MKIPHINLAFFLIVFLLMLCCAPSTWADSNPNRYALAICGGASMSAYEAGMIWGVIEVFRHVDETGDWSLGGQRRPTEFASITGSSGGGINSLLAALTWLVKPERDGGFTNRIDNNIFRDVWLTPDVNRLLPVGADSDHYLSDDALLSRKDLVAVAQQLCEKWNKPGSFYPGRKLPLGVTVTRVRPETMLAGGVAVNNQRFFIPFELRTRADGSVEFHFDPRDYPSLDDPSMLILPWLADGTPHSLSDRQVIDALLTTSAFPVGFGRKRLQYCRRVALDPEEEKPISVSPGSVDRDAAEAVCPDGYELVAAEFSDGGLFDNLPIGLARLLSESGQEHAKKRLPVEYIYLDPAQTRYEIGMPEDARACEGENPPQACFEATYDLASEMVILEGAIGTARNYELYRTLSSDTWRLNLSKLSQQMAARMEAKALNVDCAARLPFFDDPLGCRDRLRYTGRLLELAHNYHVTPILPPLSARALREAGIATSCSSSTTGAAKGADFGCVIDVPRLRRQLAVALTDLSAQVMPEDVNLNKDIRRSALSMDADRMIHVTKRRGAITGELLGAFGAFLDYKFREFDYCIGIYDAITTIADKACQRNYPAPDQQNQFTACRDRMNEELYRSLAVEKNAASRYLFARMARREFGQEDGLRFAYDPMPPEEPDMRIIFDALHASIGSGTPNRDELTELFTTERTFFAQLQSAGFQATPPPDGGQALLTLIMEDPSYWSHELVNRTTSRLVHLAHRADAIYRAREPDPAKRDSAHTALLGAGALVLRTATYKHPPFSFAPSTAPPSWFWRNLIPYEAAFDMGDGDLLLYWQPTWHINQINVGLRMGLGLTGGTFKSDATQRRENYGILGLDLTQLVNTSILSGIGITPGIYHSWRDPADADQTTFGLDVHANLLKNRIRISLGARDILYNAGNTLFFTVGITDLPGLFYWLSR